MNKIIISIALLLASIVAQAQNTGINTTNPKATLDIAASSDSKNIDTNEGILIPRLTAKRVTDISAGNRVEGTMVYVTDTPSSVLFNDTTKGFYYWDSTANITGQWVKVGGGTATVDTDTSIYAGDGTIAGTADRTVTLNNNNLIFQAGTTEYYDQETSEGNLSATSSATVAAGNFQTTGAVYVSYGSTEGGKNINLRVSSTPLTSTSWKPNDFMIIQTLEGNINLPDATLNKGRVLMVTNHSSETILFAGDDRRFMPAGLPIKVYRSRGYMFVSDGSSWHLICGY